MQFFQKPAEKGMNFAAKARRNDQCRINQQCRVTRREHNFVTRQPLADHKNNGQQKTPIKEFIFFAEKEKSPDKVDYNADRDRLVEDFGDVLKEIVPHSQIPISGGGACICRSTILNLAFHIFSKLVQFITDSINQVKPTSERIKVKP